MVTNYEKERVPFISYVKLLTKQSKVGDKILIARSLHHYLFSYNQAIITINFIIIIYRFHSSIFLTSHRTSWR